MGTFYIVATPIGNLEDITIRAIKTLFSVDGIACEDTRKTGQLLKHLREKYSEFSQDRPIEERARLMSYYEQNERFRIPEIINALKNGLNIALISDAGTPLVSDPGFRLVRECVKEGIKVESIPGPSSVLAALTLSGLPPDKFLFLGYPPHSGGKRIKLYENVKKSLEYIDTTVILFEAPHKLLTTLRELQAMFGDSDIVLCRELTKMHEEIRREKISESIAHFQQTNPKGEFVLLFHLMS